MRNISDVPPTARLGKSLADRLSRWISPGFYFAGVIAGFLACILAGYLTTRHNMFKNFTRFHQAISAETLFFPTALEVKRLAETLPADKINVIVGGSSRFNGVGQTESQLWTHDLQRRLGPDYAVIDLALRGGGADQFGINVAEMLLLEHRKVIFLADAFSISRLRPYGSLVSYRYFFFDAAARGLLIDPAVRMLGTEGDAAADFIEPQLREWKRRAAGNAALYFDDLWTWFGYRVAYLPAWTQVTASHPFWPRRKFVDNEPPTPPGGYYDRVGDAIKVGFRFTEWFVGQPYMNSIGQSAEWLPPVLRAHLLFTQIRNAPRHVNSFGPEDRALYDLGFSRFSAQMKQHGIDVVDIGRDWTDDDFTEGVHLTEQGGQKAAALLAPEVGMLARRLGYTP